MRRLTLAPLPRLRNLLTAWLKSAPSDQALAQPWCGEGDVSLWFSKSSWSLAAVAKSRQQQFGRAPVVWLPDYFCEAALQPLRKIAARVVFYPVDVTRTPDEEECDRLVTAYPPDIFVVVHYFGRPSHVPWLPSFCQQHGSWLIEDAAHVLYPSRGVGDYGDAVLYSPHKHLPIPDGALLVVRKCGPSRLAENISALNFLAESRVSFCEQQSPTRLPVAMWFIKRTLQCMGLRRQAKASFSDDVTGMKQGQGLLYPRMSELARKLLAEEIPNLPAIAELRLARDKLWKRFFTLLEYEPVPTTTNDEYGCDYVPYLSQSIMETEAVARSAADFLSHCGIPATTWPDLPPEVMANPGRHKTALALRQQSLFVPVHQTISDRDMRRAIRRMVSAATAQWTVRQLERDEWVEHWRKCNMGNMLQSWEYGVAKTLAEDWKAYRFLVCDNMEKPVGLAQILAKELPVLGGIARLNRGPVIIGEQANARQIPLKLAMISIIRLETRRRRWWRLMLAPELPASDEANSGLWLLGCRRRSVPAWSSGRIFLKRDETSILMGFDGKWRNGMRKGVSLSVNTTLQSAVGQDLEALVSQYRHLQRDRSFSGLSEHLLRALALQGDSTCWGLNLFSAHAPDGEHLGMLVSVRCGDTSVYLVGTTTENGRKCQANSVLLWQAILKARADGCTWFDIGGLNETTPRGIASFKRGLKAEPYALVGEWVC